MKKVKIFVIDDSAIYRSQIKVALRQHPQIELVGVAADGSEGVKQLSARHDVDCVVLDVEMPDMDGLEVLKELKRQKNRAKVIMFSSKTKRSSEVTLEALQSGACDFILKPGTEDSDLGPSEKIAKVLTPIVESLFYLKAEVEPQKILRSFNPVVWTSFMPRVVAIGSSTGGPAALEELFALLNPPLRTPILITQHMPAVFTKSFAERLSRIFRNEVKEAEHGDLVAPGKVYLAPGNFHMTVGREKNENRIRLDQGPPINSVRPAVDPLFESVAKIYKHESLGVVLTGMGGDGAVGAEAIREQSGVMIVQDEASCVVYGMPKAVADKSAHNFQTNIRGIAELLNEKISLGKDVSNACVNS